MRSLGQGSTKVGAKAGAGRTTIRRLDYMAAENDKHSNLELRQNTLDTLWHYRLNDQKDKCWEMPVFPRDAATCT